MIQAVAFNNKLWVIGGNDDNDLNDVWSSSNSQSWQKETITGTHFSERESHQIILFEDKL